MDLEMTIPELCFQAKDATDCYAHWHNYVSSHFTSPVMPPMVLAEAISILMQDQFEEHIVRFLNLSILNLFTLIGGRSGDNYKVSHQSNRGNRAAHNTLSTKKLVSLLANFTAPYQKRT